jgi:SAM-dependent methyltransferase
MGKPNSLAPSGHYNANHGNFQTDMYAQIRREAFGEDIGQNSWLTSDEQDRFLEWLELSPEKALLDVACGAGGPALRIAAATGCSVVGIDFHEQAVKTARSLATQRGLAERAEFRFIDATRPLPFSDASFDAITCIVLIVSTPPVSFIASIPLSMRFIRTCCSCTRSAVILGRSAVRSVRIENGMLVGFASQQQNHFADDVAHIDRFSLWRYLLIQRPQMIDDVDCKRLVLHNRFC